MKNTKSRQIAQDIAELIESGEDARYLPGRVISTSQVRRDFDCAYGTARASLNDLQRSGHVLAPQLQFVVAEASSRVALAAMSNRESEKDADVWELMELRKALERIAAGRAAKAFDKDGFYAFDFKAIHMRLQRAKGNIDKEVEADQAFHQFIYSLSGSKVIEMVLRNVRTLLRESVGQNVRSLYNERGYSSHNLKQHVDIYNAIITKNQKAAEELAANHMDFAINWLRKVSERDGDLLSGRRIAQ